MVSKGWGRGDQHWWGGVLCGGGGRPRGWWGPGSGVGSRGGRAGGLEGGRMGV